MFGREKKTKAITDYYEACFLDFQEKTHNSIKELSKENRELKHDLEFVLEQVLGAFMQNWCIDWGFAEIRKKYNISDNYDWKRDDD